MIELVKQYIEKRLELLKLEASEKTAIGFGTIVLMTLAFLALCFFVLLLNIAVGLLIGHAIGNYGYGLLIVSLFYLVVLITVVLLRKSIIKSVANKVIDFLNN